jgi:hypothetical protein
MVLQRFQDFAVAECRSRRRVTDLPRRTVNQTVGSVRLHQTRLFVTARPKQNHLRRFQAPATNHYIDSALLPAIFAGRRSGLYRVCHFGELSFLLGLG